MKTFYSQSFWLCFLLLFAFGAQAQPAQSGYKAKEKNWSQQVATQRAVRQQSKALTQPRPFVTKSQEERTKARLQTAFAQRDRSSERVLAHFQSSADSLFYQPGRSMSYLWEENSWALLVRSSLEYDTKGRLILQRDTMLDNSVSITSMVYDAFDERIGYYLYAGADTIFGLRSLIERNAANQITALIEEFFFFGEGWEPDFRLLNEYDAQGRLSMATFAFWDEGAWENFDRELYIYQGNVLVQETWQYPDEGAWVNYYRGVYTLNASNQWSSLTEFDWNDVDSAWEEDFRVINLVWQNWEAQELASGISQIFEEGNWENLERYTATYSPTLYVELFEAWEGTAWVNDYRYSEFGDAIGNPTRYLDEEWGGSAWVIIDDIRFVYTFDANNNVARLIIQAAAEFDENGNVIGEPVNVLRFDYFDYQTFTSLHQSLRPVALTAYPNPARDHVRLDGDWTQPFGGQLFDATGRPVRTYADLLPGQSLDTRGLPAGVYHLHLHNATQQASQRILKQ